MRYKITAVAPEAVLNYRADIYKRDGDYLILIYNNNKTILNLTKFITVDIEESDDEA